MFSKDRALSASSRGMFVYFAKIGLGFDFNRSLKIFTIQSSDFTKEPYEVTFIFGRPPVRTS